MIYYIAGGVLLFLFVVIVVSAKIFDKLHEQSYNCM